jgi:hypothetical protein
MEVHHVSLRHITEGKELVKGEEWRTRVGHVSGLCGLQVFVYY